jgi:hypothetical protein
MGFEDLTIDGNRGFVDLAVWWRIEEMQRLGVVVERRVVVRWWNEKG